MNGIVFADANANGILDENEPGIAGVAVSNQHDVVLTDAEGKWTGDRIKELLAISSETKNIILLGDFNESTGGAHNNLDDFLYLLPKENGDVTVVQRPFPGLYGFKSRELIYIISNI